MRTVALVILVGVASANLDYPIEAQLRDAEEQQQQQQKQQHLRRAPAPAPAPPLERRRLFGGAGAPTPPPCRSMYSTCIDCAGATFCSWCATLLPRDPSLKPLGGSCVFPRDEKCPDATAATLAARPELKGHLHSAATSKGGQFSSAQSNAEFTGWASSCPLMKKGFVPPTHAPTPPTAAPTPWHPTGVLANAKDDDDDKSDDQKPAPAPAPVRRPAATSNDDDDKSGGGGGGGGGGSQLAALQAKIAMMQKEAALRAEIAKLGGGGR